jgi:transaldolase
MTTNGASSDTPLARLSQLGQAVWVDFISRQALKDGDIARLIREDSVVGLTSNPTIFQKAIAKGEAYDEQLAEIAKDETDPQEIFLQLAKNDIVEACDLLRPIYDAGSGGDGYVSLEVAPTLAHDAEETLREARRIKQLIDRPNLLVKIPGTTKGLQAIEDAISEGISINVTLLFSIERHAEVCDAYIRGLQRLVDSGGDPGPVASVASFFVSRVDTEVDQRLGEGHELRGKWAIANAKLAYQVYLEKFSGDAWQKLADKGATPQRALWASTSTKNPDYRDVIYVEELIGDNTVNTMPTETIEAFQDHGEVRGDTVLKGVGKATKLLVELRDAGVDYGDVVETLELEGVQKFADAFDQITESIRAKRGELAAA